MLKIGIVLSGGFAKGAYQIGILKALGEVFCHDQISCMAASSVGVLNAYAFLTNRLDYAEQMWLGLDFKSFKSFMGKYVGNSFITGVIDNLVESNAASDCIMPNMYVTCFNYTQLKLNYINLKSVNKNDIALYLRAAVTMPMLTHAVDIGGNKYVDGGLIDNVPVKPMLKAGLDLCFVVHFDNGNYVFENSAFDSKLIKINFLDERFVKSSLAFDKTSIAAMLMAGYEEGSRVLSTIFKNGIDDLEYIYSGIRRANANCNGKKSRLTGDVVVGNINKFMKKFVSYKF